LNKNNTIIYILAIIVCFSIFSIVGFAEDTSAPIRSSGSPIGTITTTSTTVSLITNEDAMCRYTSSLGTLYINMPVSTQTSLSTYHSWSLVDLYDGDYNFYIRCIDSVGNFNTDDYPIGFTIFSSFSNESHFYGVKLETNKYQQTINENENATYLLNITNLGDVEDIYDLIIDKNPKNAIIILNKTTIAILPNEIEYVEMIVSSLDRGAYPVWIKAISQGYPSVSDSVQTVTIIGKENLKTNEYNEFDIKKPEQNISINSSITGQTLADSSLNNVEAKKRLSIDLINSSMQPSYFGIIAIILMISGIYFYRDNFIKNFNLRFERLKNSYK